MAESPTIVIIIISDYSNETSYKYRPYKVKLYSYTIRFTVRSGMLMKNGTIIKELFGESLKAYGFIYSGYQDKSWSFKRTINDIEHYLVIRQSNFCKGIRLELYTSIKGIYVTQRNFCPDWVQKYGHVDFLEFGDEITFRSALKVLTEIAIQYGLSELEKRSIPTRENLRQPTSKMQRLLFESYTSFSRQFKQEYGLNLEDKEQGINKIIELLEEDADSEYTEEMKDKLLRMAAYYTEILMTLYPAQLDYDRDICVIKFKKDKFCTIFLPLNEIHNALNNITVSPNLLWEIYNANIAKIKSIID